jgi:hypothetical protein
MSDGAKLVKLQVNTSGAWRDVMTFNVVLDAMVMHAAPRLFSLAQYGSRVKLRVIIPGDTAPLVDWNADQGWREWGEKIGAARAKLAA